MKPATRDWLEGLREFAAAHRLGKPLAVPESPAERAAERMILSARLADWLTGSETILADRRVWLAERDDAADADRDPAIVITTSPVGIAVVEEQLAVGSLPARAVAERTAAVTELEYRLWCIRHPDDARDRHINIWNWIKTLSSPGIRWLRERPTGCTGPGSLARGRPTAAIATSGSSTVATPRSSRRSWRSRGCGAPGEAAGRRRRRGGPVAVDCSRRHGSLGFSGVSPVFGAA
jgi:hypothetical protein